MEHHTQVQILQDAIEMLNDPDTNLPEVVADERLVPEALAQLLMANVELEVFGPEQKMYWLKAALHMGPDWIDAVATAVAFMRKVEGFK